MVITQNRLTIFEPFRPFLESGYARRIVIIISTAVTTAIRIMEYPKELTNVPLFNAFA